ncbi:MAG: hypothetical protein LBV60_22715 [Streptomyces sp.]|jgi:hypothetical protein|nr:hypothetical protein [Streptomyces sp.]
MARTTTTRTRKTAATTEVKPAPRKAPARKTPAKPPTKKIRRKDEWRTDLQGFATCAALHVGIITERIQDWRDHRDGTACRALDDGTLHYTQSTRALTWQAVCRMGAFHAYPINHGSTTAQARIEAAHCTALHHDLTGVQPLTADELADLGILHTSTWARPDVLGEPDTETLTVVPLQARPRVLADQLARANSAAADTQPIPVLAPEQAKEHPQP